MKKSNLTASDYKKELDKPLPTEAIKQREGGRGIMLDYLEGWWVIQNANRIFGIDGWGYKPVWEKMEHIPLLDYKDKYGKMQKTGLYTVPVTLWITIGDKRVTRGDAGTTQYYGEEGKEMAIKGCVTDALKRCFRTFGAQFGLELYDKGDVTPPTTRIKGQKSFLSQEQLMEKFGMDKSQVAPKCPSCGATMSLVPRKDGSSLFWSCPNWKTKGCQGYNVDDIDINGVITTKKKSQPVVKASKTEQTDVEDIPF